MVLLVHAIADLTFTLQSNAISLCARAFVRNHINLVYFQRVVVAYIKAKDVNLSNLCLKAKLFFTVRSKSSFIVVRGCSNTERELTTVTDANF